MNRYCCPVALLAIAFAMPALAQAPTDLDAYVARAMKTFEVPGIAVTIVKDDNVVIAKGYGVRKLGETTADFSFDFQDLLFRPVRVP